MKNNNILVTGANGQLGSELKALQNNYPPFNFFFVSKAELNITDEYAITSYLITNNINYIINCAAYTAVDLAETNEELAFLVNAKGPELLAKASKNLDILLLHVSTDYVFSGNESDDYTESDKTLPLSVYGKSKLYGEVSIASNCEKYYIIRTSWLYSSFNNNFLKSMLKLSETKKELGIVADQYGSPTYARDLAKALMVMLVKTHKEEVKSKYGVYHYSNENSTTWCAFANEIMEIAQTECVINPIITEEYPLPAPRPKNSSMSKTKIKNTFSMTIQKWENSLKDCMNELLVK